MREFIAWKAHKGLKSYLFWGKECLDSKISQIGNVFNPHKSLPGRQLNAAPVTQEHRNSNVLYRKTKNPFEPKLCKNKGV